jgi:hypothetical protein
MEDKDAFISLLLFLAGAPALVYQVVGKDVRDMMNSQGMMRILTAAPAVGGIAIVMIAYWRSGPIVNSQPELAARIWDLALILLVVLALVTVWGIFPLMSKRRLVQGIARNAIGRAAHQREDCARGTVSYGEEQLQPLVLFGKECDAGEERSWALLAVGSLADDVLSQPDYSGDRLEDIVLALDSILIGGRLASTHDNFKQAIGILRQIVNAYELKILAAPDFCDADTALAFRMLKLWGQKTLDFEESELTIECLDILEGLWARAIPSASEAIREIGVAAVRQDKIWIGTTASLKIKEMLLGSGGTTAPPEIFFDQLGLLAALWAHGSSGRSWAARQLDASQSSPEMLLPRQIEAAVEHFRLTGRFTIADQVQRMNAEYCGEPAGRQLVS